MSGLLLFHFSEIGIKTQKTVNQIPEEILNNIELQAAVKQVCLFCRFVQWCEWCDTSVAVMAFNSELRTKDRASMTAV